MRRRFRKKNLRNMEGIALVLCLLAAALMLPELYFSYYDKRTQNELEYLDAQVDTYQLQYEDFSYKIAALAFGAGGEAELSAARLQEADAETKERLTAAVNREFDSFAGYQLVWQALSCRTEDLKSCELYTAYPRESGGEQLQGFTFWRIAYGRTDEYELCLLLDAEFEKIVSLCVWNKITQICFEEFMAVNEVIEFDIKNDDYVDDDLHYRWIDGMARYYGMYDEIMDFGGSGSYEEAYGMMEEIEMDSFSANSQAIGQWRWPAGYSVFELFGGNYGYGEVYSSLALEYYMCESQNKGYYVAGFRCFQNFLQL